MRVMDKLMDCGLGFRIGIPYAQRLYRFIGKLQSARKPIPDWIKLRFPTTWRQRT